MPHSTDYWWIWCLCLVLGFSGCIGSFLNVVIYRLPRGIPLNDPCWSFCPHCHHTIRWYDNIPLVSYFVLNGRCRDCGGTISPRYVVIEAMMILTGLVLFDAFFVGRMLDGLNPDSWSVAFRFGSDWPIFAATLILFAALIAMSPGEREAEMARIRQTYRCPKCGKLAYSREAPPAPAPH